MSVCCEWYVLQIEVSGTGRSLVQGSRTKCECVIVCDHNLCTYSGETERGWTKKYIYICMICHHYIAALTVNSDNISVQLKGRFGAWQV